MCRKCKDSAYDDALFGYGKGLAIRMKVFGENHIDAACSYFNIGLVMKKKADFVQALTYLQKANAIFQQQIEIFQEFQDDVLISECYIEIGRVLNSQNKYEEALVNFRKALKINREINGDNHASTCDCYDAIGIVMFSQGRYDDALIGYGKALAIRMKVFGEHHENTAHSYFNIGLVMKKKADSVQALTYFQKANAIYARELGAEHPHTVKVNAHIIDSCQKRIDQRNKAVHLQF